MKNLSFLILNSLKDKPFEEQHQNSKYKSHYLTPSSLHMLQNVLQNELSSNYSLVKDVLMFTSFLVEHVYQRINLNFIQELDEREEIQTFLKDLHTNFEPNYLRMLRTLNSIMKNIPSNVKSCYSNIVVSSELEVESSYMKYFVSDHFGYLTKHHPLFMDQGSQIWYQSYEMIYSNMFKLMISDSSQNDLLYVPEIYQYLLEQRQYQTIVDTLETPSSFKDSNKDSVVNLETYPAKNPGLYLVPAEAYSNLGNSIGYKKCISEALIHVCRRQRLGQEVFSSSEF